MIGDPFELPHKRKLRPREEIYEMTPSDMLTFVYVEDAEHCCGSRRRDV